MTAGSVRGVEREGGGLLGRFAVGVCVGANSAKNAYSGGGCPGECVCHVSVCTGYLLTLIANEFPSIFSFAFSCFVSPLFACKSRVGQGKERQGKERQTDTRNETHIKLTKMHGMPMKIVKRCSTATQPPPSTEPFPLAPPPHSCTASLLGWGNVALIK